MTDEDYENGAIYNKFSVTTKNPSADDMLVDVSSGGTGVNFSMPSIIKDFIVEEGLKVPNATFRFMLSPISISGEPYLENNMPSIATVSTSYFESDTEMLSKRSLISLPDFTYEGVYVYEVKEIPDTVSLSDEAQLIYSKSVYYLHMVVVEDDEGNFNVVEFGYSMDVEGFESAERMVFINHYLKNTDEIDDQKIEPLIPSIIKDFKVEADQVIPSATFTFSLKPVSINDTLFSNGNMPRVEDVTTTYSRESRNQLNRDIDITLPDFTHEGVYVYEVKETPDTYLVTNGEQLIYSKSVYYLRMVVVEDTDGNLVVSDYSYSTDVEGHELLETMTFTNYYFKHTLGDVFGPSLVLSKTTTQEISRITQTFDFNISIHAPENEEADTYSYVVVDANGVKGPEIEGFYNTEFTVSIGNGEYVYFKSLPEGSTYTVSEAETAQYTAYFSITEGGVKGALKKGRTTGTQTLHDDGSIVDYVNEFKRDELPGTGASTFYQKVYTLMTLGGFVIVMYQGVRRKKSGR